MLEAFYWTWKANDLRGEHLEMFFFAELNQFIYIPDTMDLKKKKKSGNINYITEYNMQ